ncbi:RsmB/NOP family class I SAM-dependent RNA methyltransferase [Anaerocolumna xylanovorans]|uniref:NOL1/NOP2/sun family putative RNA methylase n=1 Tax=Anaerocolumna xylanovorans DSM 12503 TaxID=1121345 RepID=A0A1M7YAX0_9FIRM|nr:RsmB/NOP family class I SAM-dependent RNA methyltransferase [Anaerocolumna xylanovorans]SHO49790.1 NOL1/NOP2/sun family putative RNA methylase [Anaerocolumna xylanovorans DSM 12503]
MKLPQTFEERMKSLLGEEYKEYEKSLDEKHYSGIRVNTLKITPEEFEKIAPFPITRIPWIKNGYYYNQKEQPARHPYYFAGLYYIQEPSAMTPASLLPITPGDKVLDICAAPGGKSTELGARLCGKGVLISNDISNSRAKALLKNIELFGIRNPVIASEAPGKLVDYFTEYFDKILVDAPCSGEGMFRKSPAIMKNWEQYGVGYYNKLQKEIIIQAAKMLKPGGYLLYSTCTFSPEENEGTISYLLEQFPEFQVVNPLTDSSVSYEGFSQGRPEWVGGREELKNCIRLWPHKIKGEGHFIALLRKGDSASGINQAESAESCQGKVKLPKETEDFLAELSLPIKKENLLVKEDRLYLLPDGLPTLKGLRLLRQGLLLGEMKKGRFEPSQALACALSQGDYKKTIDLNSGSFEVIKYLKCETIEGNSPYGDGYHLVTTDSFSLGWGKLLKDSLKNKYLPGWRWM